MPETLLEDVASLLLEARSVVLVPGYGLARARAHHSARALADALTRGGASVSWAVHPVAGRLPGHMNVLLDEAGVPSSSQVDLAAASSLLASADVALLVGADDVVNPSLDLGPLDVRSARRVVALRLAGPGFVGTPNPLWDDPAVTVLDGDVGDTLARILTWFRGAPRYPS